MQLRHPSTCVKMSKDPKAVKLEKSHKYLANGIYLLEQYKKSTVYLSDETNVKKLLAFLVRIYEVMTRFTRVYFGYEYPHSINTFASDISEEIKKACLYNQEVMRITKVRVSVLLRNDHKAQDIIAHIFRKIQDKLLKYLVFIDFFNKEMYNKCNFE